MLLVKVCCRGVCVCARLLLCSPVKPAWVGWANSTSPDLQVLQEHPQGAPRYLERKLFCVALQVRLTTPVRLLVPSGSLCSLSFVSPLLWLYYCTTLFSVRLSQQGQLLHRQVPSTCVGDGLGACDQRCCSRPLRLSLRDVGLTQTLRHQCGPVWCRQYATADMSACADH